MAIVEGNTVKKCIHEALDLDWCECDDAIRAELHVQLPRPGELWLPGGREVTDG